MPGVRVVTDSATDLPAELVAEHDVIVVPLDVRVGDADPATTSALSGAAFWELAASTDALAQTSAPSPGAFAAAYAAAASSGADGVVCVTLSARLSATHQAAVAGASSAEIPVTVVDSTTVTMAEGFVVLEAAEAAARGGDLATVEAAARSCIPDVEVFGALGGLEALRRGGRIGSSQAFFGSLLAVKPIVEIRDGVVVGESRQRTRARSLGYLVDKAVAAGPLRRLAVAHGAAPDLDTFLEMLGAARPDDKIVVTYIGPVIGAHAGPGTIGLCMQRA